MANSEVDLFKLVGDVADEVYFIFEVNNNSFQYISPSFEKFLNQPVEKFRNRPDLLFKYVHKDDQVHVGSCCAKALEMIEKTKFEFRIKPNRKTEKHIQLNIYPILGPDRLLAGTATDITILRTNFYYAEKINARKNSMLTILAHDLKGPIGVVKMMASSVMKELANNKDALHAVNTIQELCKRNIDLINDLLKHEFLESPEVDLRKERVDMAAALRDIVENYKRSEIVISKKFKFSTSSEKIFVEIDNLKLMQAFNNLISNAIKFTHDDGVISIDMKEKSHSVSVKITDNGIGIPADLQPYLFDQFTRARRVGLQGEETTGLGMSLIKTIVKLHNGKISFTSEENKGTSFVVEIPKM